MSVWGKMWNSLQPLQLSSGPWLLRKGERSSLYWRDLCPPWAGWGKLGWCSALPALPHPWTMGTMEKGGGCSCSSWAAQLVWSRCKSAQETKMDKTWVGNRWAHLLAAVVRTVSNAISWSFCRWERWCLCWFLWRFMSHFCCRHGADAEQGLEMRSFCVTARTLHCDLPLPEKA